MKITLDCEFSLPGCDLTEIENTIYELRGLTEVENAIHELRDLTIFSSKVLNYFFGITEQISTYRRVSLLNPQLAALKGKCIIFNNFSLCRVFRYAPQHWPP
jgi:hypothetical protein